MLHIQKQYNAVVMHHCHQGTGETKEYACLSCCIKTGFLSSNRACEVATGKLKLDPKCYIDTSAHTVNFGGIFLFILKH